MTQEEHIQQTVQKSIDSFWKSQKEQQLSIFEFLYIQFQFIQKRWWLLQLGCLLLLWILLNLGFSESIERKIVAIIIPFFSILILPELWKTRRFKMDEIENSTIHTTRDIYLARLILFGAFDLFGLTILWSIIYPLGITNLILELLIPFNGICIIILGTLNVYKGRELYLPLGLCTLFTIIWIMTISNEQLYIRFSLQLWIILFFISTSLLIFIIIRLIHNCKEVLAWN